MWKEGWERGLLLALVLMAGCSTNAPAPEQRSEEPLLTSLQVTMAAGQVSFTLQVTNVSSEPVELNFNSGQSADFVVTRGGERIWRWSDDQMFTQALRQEVLAPGDSRSYQAEWQPAAGLAGEFTARGMLTAREHRPEQAAQFSLP